MSKIRTKSRSGDPTPVTGVVAAPARLLRPVPGLDVSAPTSQLDKHITRLLALHKNVSVKFRKVDLAAMDDTTKRALLASINRVLGIEPLT